MPPRAPPDDDGVELLVREVGSVAEVAAALARLAAGDLPPGRRQGAPVALRLLRLRVSAREELPVRLFGGGPRRAPRRRRRREVDGAPRARPPPTKNSWSAPLCARCSTPSCRRDHAAAHFGAGMEVHHPFLSAFIAKFALELPGRMSRPAAEDHTSAKEDRERNPVLKNASCASRSRARPFTRASAGHPARAVVERTSDRSSGARWCASRRAFTPSRARRRAASGTWRTPRRRADVVADADALGDVEEG